MRVAFSDIRNRLPATGYRLLLPPTLLGAGVWLAARYAGFYEFAWTHPSVVLIGQFALLAAGALTRPWALAGFWVFSGATAYALVERAANDLHGGLAAAAAAAVAAALAFALFARLSSGRSA
jgi:hypothetical protein